MWVINSLLGVVRCKKKKTQKRSNRLTPIVADQRVTRWGKESKSDARIQLFILRAAVVQVLAGLRCPSHVPLLSRSGKCHSWEPKHVFYIYIIFLFVQSGNWQGEFKKSMSQAVWNKMLKIDLNMRVCTPLFWVSRQSQLFLRTYVGPPGVLWSVLLKPHKQQSDRLCLKAT